MLNTLRNRWRATWQPDMYHGWGRRRSYFEGWYFKIVDPLRQETWAIIPGISMEADGQQHAFIQLLDGGRSKAYYHHFPAEDFQPAPDRFALQLGDNYFSADRLQLHLPELQGELRQQQLHPWPKMLGAPGIMGWYGFVPFMQCYHGVVSVWHELQGQLVVHQRPVDFDGGRGYTEKDWGTSFPSCWIWMQSNHFGTSEEPVSLMASVARIPWLGSHFIGYIVGFLYKGKVHRFATYTGASMKAELGPHTVQLAFRDKRYRLEIIAHQAPGAELRSPLSGQMTGKVNESMQAQLQVSFYEHEKLVFSGEGKQAGLEVAGPIEQILTKDWRR